MEFRNLGRSGLRVSTIGLGCNNFGGRLDLEATRRVIHKAFDLGITLFDTADVYGDRGGSETLMGEVLGDMRKHIVLATKYAMPMTDNPDKLGASRNYIVEAVEASLRRLKTDYIDCSNFTGWRMVEAQWTAKTANLNAFVSCQDEYSLVVRDAEKDLIPAARSYGMGLLPYFPLASGLLTGKYRRNAPMPADARLTQTQRLADRYLNDRNWQISERLIDFAEARGHTALELAFSWLLAQSPVSSVIAGATKPEQLEQNVQAGTWVMSAEELAEIDQITRSA